MVRKVLSDVSIPAIYIPYPRPSSQIIFPGDVQSKLPLTRIALLAMEVSEIGRAARSSHVWQVGRPLWTKEQPRLADSRTQDMMHLSISSKGNFWRVPGRRSLCMRFEGLCLGAVPTVGPHCITALGKSRCRSLDWAGDKTIRLVGSARPSRESARITKQSRYVYKTTKAQFLFK